MKERPILFSAPMVRAILDGRKTVTRRIVRERLGAYSDGSVVVLDKNGDPIDVELRPYAMAGERLWVRETFGTLTGNGVRTVYRADADPPMSMGGEPVVGMKWRPSIFMRRAESRLSLDVLSVRVERLQEITEEDARAEGVEGARSGGHPAGDDECSAREVFRDLWDTINGKRAPWGSNPWVWRVEFRRVS